MSNDHHHLIDHDELAEAIAPSTIREELRELGLLGKMWTLSVVVFCAARAGAVWPLLAEHGVNPWWFLALDVGTAPTYGLGQAMGVKILRDGKRPMIHAAPWIAMLFISFLAPYVYLLASAGQLPSYVIYGIVAWIVVFAAIAGWRMVREVKATPET